MAQYRDLSITQLFYLANMYHDLLYLYGFDEVSGNFQQYNFDKGGAEGDAVIVDAQDSGGFNNRSVPHVPLEYCEAIPRWWTRCRNPYSRAFSRTVNPADRRSP
ncbi:fungalysin metallopeptidase (M36) domain-containing protein [Rhizoctonia solani AG-1 IA]|uniref:Extracellular metalloproteinase n=1 Tax=Thanatephorus cucumeris (strain AG1-IA) TaxID=983506 RepID=L8WFI6_THACA|nr:fungalysin metallopeptidase (M36) domain-containing protein [Rhizoctonia solani AG-1 IA]